MSDNVNVTEATAGVSAPEISSSELDKNGFIKRGRKVSLDARKARAGYVFVLPFLLGLFLIYILIFYWGYYYFKNRKK